jgi:hypothetical protein
MLKIFIGAGRIQFRPATLPSGFNSGIQKCCKKKSGIQKETKGGKLLIVVIGALKHRLRAYDISPTQR